VTAAVQNGLRAAGIELPAEADRQAYRAAMEQAKASGVDVEKIKEDAMTSFLEIGVASGSITAEAAAAAMAKHADGAEGGRGRGENKGRGQGGRGQGGRGQGGRGQGGRGAEGGRGRGENKGQGGRGKDTANKIEGMKEAVTAAVQNGLRAAGIELPAEADRQAYRAAMEQAKASGVDVEKIKEDAMTSFLEAGVASGSITAEAAAAAMAKHAEKHGQKVEGLKETAKAAVQSAISSAGIELPSGTDNDKAAYRKAMEEAKAAGIDIEQVKKAAVAAFLDSKVADGSITAEEASAALQRVEDGGRGKGKGNKNGGGKGYRNQGDTAAVSEAALETDDDNTVVSTVAKRLSRIFGR